MIEVRHLRKTYGGQVALANLSLDIPAGEVFGLIGPNGAGKTTLIRILATLLEPTYGEVRIAGIDALANPLAVHPLIGYMSDVFALYEQMLVWEYLDHFARCYRTSQQHRAALVQEVLELVSLDVRRDAEIRTLSRGMRQRLCFAKTLLHQPRVLLLDEPASGMDPAGRLEFRGLLRRLHDMGRTVLISSHILTEMADFCTMVGVVEQGRLLAAGRVSEIIERLTPGMRLEIELLDRAAEAATLVEAAGGISVSVRGESVACRWKLGKERLPALHKQLVEHHFQVCSFVARSDDLEDLYMSISQHHTA